MWFELALFTSWISMSWEIMTLFTQDSTFLDYIRGGMAGLSDFTLCLLKSKLIVVAVLDHRPQGLIFDEWPNCHLKNTHCTIYFEADDFSTSGTINTFACLQTVDN